MSGSITAGRARPLGNYPHVKRAGDLLFLSGTTARQPDGSIGGVTRGTDGQVKRDAAAQTRLVIQNISSTLESAGASLADCVDVLVFLTDMADFGAFNQVYGEFFDHTGPARTTVSLTSLPHPDMVVEMKVVACVPQARASRA
jgi:2-aminomuconate deaminase